MQCIHDFQKEFNRRPFVCEIGCADGQGTARYGGFCEKVVCIDPMKQGRFDIPSYEIEDIKHDEMKLEAFKSNLSHIGNRVELIVMCSAWPETFEKVKEILGLNEIDILLIDGCHHPFEAVYKDFELYYPLVRGRGFIVFDDIYEPCIRRAYDKAQSAYGLAVHEEWKMPKCDGLQEIGVLRK